MTELSEIERILKEDWGIIARADKKDLKTAIFLAKTDYRMMEILAGIALFNPNKNLGDEAIDVLREHRRSKVKDKENAWPGYYDINILKYGGHCHGDSDKDVYIRRRAIAILENIEDIGMLAFMAEGQEREGEGGGFTDEDRRIAHEALEKTMAEQHEITIFASHGVIDVIYDAFYNPPEIRMKLIGILKCFPEIKEYWAGISELTIKRIGKYLGW